MELPNPDAPRIVKPRKSNFDNRGIIAITREKMFIERTGETVDPAKLWQYLAAEDSCILACENFGPHLKRLVENLGAHPDFNYRLTPHFRRVTNEGVNTETPFVEDVIINFVGFRSSSRNHKRARYHYPLDPVHFVRDSLKDAVATDETLLQKLFQWAKGVREFCQREGLQVKPSAGGLAAQLLRDSRFYPEPRRKAPRLINDTVRSQLPGNYYRLHAEAGKRHRATYLDISNAHHEMAARLKFPDVNSLHLYGGYVEGKLYASAKSRLLRLPGLFHLRASVPAIPANKFPPPYLSKSGVRDIWVYSNELPMLRDLGVEIWGIHAAIVSEKSEKRGLSDYARWSVEQIAANPAEKYWLKPTLHATYGLLAARPSEFETGYYRAKGGIRGEYPVGPVSLPARIKRSPHEIESRVANVIHRGMIEAEVRAEALSRARQLTAEGFRVLAVYADSLFVAGDAIPLLGAPWRVSEHVTGLRFMDPTHFVSNQITRLPGLPRTAREGHRRSTQLARYLRDIAREEFERRRVENRLRC